TGVRLTTGDALLRGGCLKHFSDDDYDPALYEKILAADKANLQVMIHAIGNRANDVVLTIFERVAKINGAKDRRFRIEHAHNVRAEDLKRFGNSKIIASMQPHLFFGGEPYRDLLNSGAVLAFGSDASITDFNPLYGIHAAVNYGEQAISVEEAVRAYTVGSAYAEFQENVKGSISIGKLADMIILSDDIFSVNPSRITETKVLTTIMDGKIVYQFK
ncbi:MAG TPA: amidohydrolase family protein, partial [Pyrinomonadaceae bacterium]|nr:amidohydrolase family protein [Pyrinomonadaceae bacterium]